MAIEFSHEANQSPATAERRAEILANPGFGDYFSDFSQAGDFSKWILSFLMLTGRLEVFTVISILHPAFWRR